MIQLNKVIKELKQVDECNNLRNLEIHREILILLKLQLEKLIVEWKMNLKFQIEEIQFKRDHLIYLK